VTLPLGAFLTVWAILALNIASPGPNVLNTITTAMGSGRAAGLASAAAVGIGIGLWCLGMSLGMAAVFRVVPYAQDTLTLMAAGLLVWFAMRYLRAGFAMVGREPSLRGLGGLGPRAAFLRSPCPTQKTWLGLAGLRTDAGTRRDFLYYATAGAGAVTTGAPSGRWSTR
jgi:threonine/homoserine/homoserine lactone efflux protein